jgi:cation:H+ antiporter
MKVNIKALIWIVIGLTAPWFLIWLITRATPFLLEIIAPSIQLGIPAAIQSLTTVSLVFITGLGVLGAAFLLAWAAETAEKDVPRAFAIAVLAVLAVAPEYAVDALFAWEAGIHAGTPRGIEAGNLAIANMTGANRILIGIGWAGIALFTIYRRAAIHDPAVEKRTGFLADAVKIDRDINLEIIFLLLATIWAFFVPFNGGIDILDLGILVGIYVVYIAIIIRGEVEPVEEYIGVPGYLQSYRKPARIATVIGLVLYSGFIIITAVEPFAHGLEEIGVDIGVPSFFMIQWIAPLASEAPELIVVIYLVNKARSTAGFNALISSKLNQWTLLIGTLVVVHSIALGRYGILSFDARQAAEIWITAAQSFFAIAVLLNFEISVREALMILILFLSQVVIEFLIIRDAIDLHLTSHDLLLVYTGVYLVLGTVFFIMRWTAFRGLVRDAKRTITTAF